MQQTLRDAYRYEKKVNFWTSVSRFCSRIKDYAEARCRMHRANQNVILKSAGLHVNHDVKTQK